MGKKHAPWLTTCETGRAVVIQDSQIMLTDTQTHTDRQTQTDKDRHRDRTGCCFTGYYSVGLVRVDNIHGAVHANHQPGRQAPVNTIQMLLEPLHTHTHQSGLELAGYDAQGCVHGISNM